MLIYRHHWNATTWWGLFVSLFHVAISVSKCWANTRMFAFENKASLDGPVHSTTQEDVEIFDNMNVLIWVVHCSIYSSGMFVLWSTYMWQLCSIYLYFRQLILILLHWCFDVLPFTSCSYYVYFVCVNKQLSDLQPTSFIIGFLNMPHRKSEDHIYFSYNVQIQKCVVLSS